MAQHGQPHLHQEELETLARRTIHVGNHQEGTFSPLIAKILVLLLCCGLLFCAIMSVFEVKSMCLFTRTRKLIEFLVMNSILLKKWHRLGG